jgi:drug/metabolite transporter (DMT)-like permease
VPVSTSERTTLVGTILVAFSSIAFSTAGFFTRLIDTDVWTMLFWRGLSGGVFILCFVGATRRERTLDAFRSIGRAGLACIVCSAVSTICFIWALRLTTVADVTIIYATAPLLAATIAWIWMSERPHAITLAASILAMLGVALMCRGAVKGGNILGNCLHLR